MSTPTVNIPTPPTNPAWEHKFSRVFKAPRALVFRCWADPKLMARWFGPRGFGMPECAMDFREGGTFEMNMAWPDGTPNRFHGTYRTVVTNEQIVWSSTFPGFREDFQWTIVHFEDHPDGTQVHVHQCWEELPEQLLPATQGAPVGWAETVDRLDDLLLFETGKVPMPEPSSRKAVVTLISDTEVHISRWFAAPRALLYRTFVEPELHGRWYGGGVYKQVECTIDAKVGGSYAWTLETPDGERFSFKGEYRDVRPPAWIEATEQFLLGDQWTAPLVSRVTMMERDGQTFFTNRLTYASQADRDGHLGAGMEEGMNRSLVALDALLASL